MQKKLNNHSLGTTTFIAAIENMLPPVFARHQLTELTGGLINSRTISNLQSKKIGPPAVKFKGRVGLEKGTFVTWLKTQVTTFNNQSFDKG